LLKRDVVKRATAQQDRFQRSFLFGRWVQSVLGGFPHTRLLHTGTFCLIGRKAENSWDNRHLTATRLSSPGLKAGALAGSFASPFV
jgi:hypothetical protein